VLSYALRRLLIMIPVLIGTTLVTFFLMNVVPGDPIAGMVDQRTGEMDKAVMEQLRKDMGLDRPLPVQYATFLGKAVRGDLGRSYFTNGAVTPMIMERLPATGRLALFALFLAVAFGLLLGIVAAAKRGSAVDTGSMMMALVGVSMPNFWLGLMLMYLFAVQLRWLPASGIGDGEFTRLLLPGVTLAMTAMAIIARITRSAMLNVISLEYIQTARSKGLSERSVIYKHALKNAMIPVVTIVGVQLGGLLAGAVVVEQVFNWPGIGRLLVDSIAKRDLPVVQGIVLIAALIFTSVNLLVDLTYGLLDPRIRYS
jgi:peptide/nickel transport system permease protein